MLADPVACPGGLEGLAAWLAWHLPDVPVATIVVTLDRLLALAAAVAFARLATRLRVTTRAAVVGALTLAATLVSAPELAPTVAASTAAACLVWLAIVKRPAAARRAALVRGLLPGGIAAIVTPLLTIPAAIAVTFALVVREPDDAPADGRRWVHGLTAGATVLAVGLLTVWLVPPVGRPVTACLVPFTDAAAGPAPIAALTAALAPIGLAVLALAALGALAARRPIVAAPRRTALAVAALVVLPVLFAPPGSDAARVLSPPTVALWLLAAAGVEAAIGRLRTPRQQRGALAFLLLVPLLQLARPAPPVPTDDRPLGHDAMTARWLRAFADRLPPGSTVVREDALTDLLWRGAAWSGRPTPAFVADDEEAVRRVLGSGDVFALPRAQRHLGPRGLTASPFEVAGVARLAAGYPCVVASGNWRPGPSDASADGLAFVASDAGARGPLVIYLAAGGALRVYARDWPRGIERGFDLLTYDLASDADRARLAADRAADGVPAGWAAEAAFVARVELWRIPGAPLALPVTVEGPVTAVLTRVTAAADPDHPPRLCPSYGTPVTPVGG